MHELKVLLKDQVINPLEGKDPYVEVNYKQHPTVLGVIMKTVRTGLLSRYNRLVIDDQYMVVDDMFVEFLKKIDVIVSKDIKQAEYFAKQKPIAEPERYDLEVLELVKEFVSNIDIMLKNKVKNMKSVKTTGDIKRQELLETKATD